MKKSLIYIFAVLAAVMFTSCSDNDEPVNKQSFTSTINTRAIEGDAVYFSQNSAKVEVNYTGMTIQFTSDYNDDQWPFPLVHHWRDEDDLSLGHGLYLHQQRGLGQRRHQFTQGLPRHGHRHDVVQFHGRRHHDGCQLEPSALCLLDDHGHQSRQWFTYYNQKSAYLFALDCKGETCTMQISNFAPNITGSIQALEIQFNDLKVVPTLTGYTITADEADSNYSGFYTITDLVINLDSQCQVINGSFKCSDLDFKITGDLFPNVF